MIANADTIKEAARIEEVVGDFVTLQKKGASFMACCPFHAERTPSFSVSPSRGIFKCFGCDTSGDAVGFLMKQLGITYPEAIEYIAKKYNIKAEYSHTGEPDFEEKEIIRAAMSAVQDHFKKNATRGLDYFAQRGLTPDTMGDFGIGFCDSATVPMVPAETLQKAGLANKKGNLYYYFRVTLPIRNEKGTIVSFAGRTIAPDGTPKYLNGAESPIFSKSRVLFGLWENLEYIRRLKLAILVEGYADVMSLHQKGCRQAVAACGTALTDEQCGLLARFTPNLILLFDGDKAGRKAMFKAALTAYPHFENVRVVLLNGGHDPDSFVREKGFSALYNKLHNQWKDAGVFYCTNELDFGKQAGKAAVGLRLRQLLKSVDDTRRAALVATLAESLGISVAALTRFIFPVISEAHSTAYASFNAHFRAFDSLIERRARWYLVQKSADTSGMSPEVLKAHTAKMERVEEEVRIMSDLRTALWAVEEIYISHLKSK